MQLASQQLAKGGVAEKAESINKYNKSDIFKTPQVTSVPTQHMTICAGTKRC